MSTTGRLIPAHPAFPGRGITHPGMLFAGRGAEKQRLSQAFRAACLSRTRTGTSTEAGNRKMPYRLKILDKRMPGLISSLHAQSDGQTQYYWKGSPIPWIFNLLPGTPVLTEIAEQMWCQVGPWTVLKSRYEYIRTRFERSILMKMVYAH